MGLDVELFETDEASTRVKPPLGRFSRAADQATVWETVAGDSKRLPARLEA